MSPLHSLLPFLSPSFLPPFFPPPSSFFNCVVQVKSADTAVGILFDQPNIVETDWDNVTFEVLEFSSSLSRPPLLLCSPFLLSPFPPLLSPSDPQKDQPPEFSRVGEKIISKH
jgi:hypothetical protein